MSKKNGKNESLKKRINGEYGHLENKESLKLLSSISHPDLSWVIAAHLSEKNNKIDLVKKMIKQVKKRLEDVKK